MKPFNPEEMFCLNCNGIGLIVTPKGNTRDCKACERTGLTEKGLKHLEDSVKELEEVKDEN